MRESVLLGEGRLITRLKTEGLKRQRSVCVVHYSVGFTTTHLRGSLTLLI